MAYSRGPKTVTDGLVFNYDTGNEKSFVGEPTTNLVDARWGAVWSIDGSGQGSIGTRTMIDEYHCRIVDVNSNTRQSEWVYNLSPNTTYTFSVRFKKISGAPTLRYQIQPYNGGTYITSYFPTTTQIGLTDIDGWQTASYTITTPANTDRVLWFMQDGDDYTTYNHSFELKGVQCEAKPHATPFTSNTRSVTQGLLDLTRNETINLSNVSFDSNAQMVFDGTNDYIITSNMPPMYNWSTEVVINLTNFTSAQKVILDVNLGIRFEISNGKFNSHFGDGNGWIYTNLPSTSNYSQNTYYHVVVTVQSGGYAKIYVNGVLENAITIGSGVTPEVPMYIGRYTGTSGYEITGYLPMVRVYSKELTSNEVYSNYNAIKSRFGI